MFLVGDRLILKGTVQPKLKSKSFATNPHVDDKSERSSPQSISWASQQKRSCRGQVLKTAREIKINWLVWFNPRLYSEQNTLTRYCSTYAMSLFTIERGVKLLSGFILWWTRTGWGSFWWPHDHMTTTQTRSPICSKNKWIFMIFTYDLC